MAGRSKKAMKSDKSQKALMPGKRKSENGNTYYENRKNHSDVKPSTRLDCGGFIKKLIGKK